MEKIARRSWGRNRRRIRRNFVEDTRFGAPGPSREVRAIQRPLTTKQQAEAMKAKINLPLRSPSTGPPGAIGLATPFFRHLARPRQAEKQERMKVRKNNESDHVSAP